MHSPRPSSFRPLGDKRRHAEPTLPLLHQLLEAAARRGPDTGLEGNIARTPSATLVLARLVATSALAAAVIVHFAGMVAGRGADAGPGALVAAVGAFSATRVQAAANMRFRKERIFTPLRIVRGRRGRSRGQSRQRRQRQFREVSPTQITPSTHFRLRQSGCSCCVAVAKTSNRRAEIEKNEKPFSSF